MAKLPLATRSSPGALRDPRPWGDRRSWAAAEPGRVRDPWRMVDGNPVSQTATVVFDPGRTCLGRRAGRRQWPYTIALPIAAGVFAPAFGLVLRPEIAA